MDPLHRKLLACLHFVILSVLLLTTISQQSAAQFAFQSETNATHDSRVTKILCADQPYKLTKLNYCCMGTFPNQTNFLNVSIYAPMTLNFIMVTTKLYYKYVTYRPFLVDWKVEACHAFRFPKRRNIVTNMVMKVIAETVPHLYYKCPHGNRTYTAVWLFPSKFVLTTIPSGDYRLDIRFQDKDDIILFAIQAFISVRKYGIMG